MITIESQKIFLSSPKKLFFFALILLSVSSITLFICLFHLKPLVPTKYSAKLRKINKPGSTTFKYYELIIMNHAPTLKINSEYNFLFIDSNAIQLHETVIILAVIPYSDNNSRYYYVVSKNNKMDANNSSDYLFGDIVILINSDITLFKKLIYK